MTFTGKIIAINTEVETDSLTLKHKPFRNNEIAVADADHNQFVFNVSGNRCEFLNDLKEGDHVEVTYLAKWCKYKNGRYFQKNDLLTIKKL